MNTLRIILGLFLGLFVGAMVNGSFIELGTKIFPFPNGVNFDTPEGMEAFSELPLKYYVFPFIAHAMGTLSGCLVALLFVRTYATYVVYTIGSLFFIGGIMAVYMINAPLWFDILDLSMAYIPMAWLATKSKLAKTA
jgi:hypothetical protein